jgi:ABC-type dipeptide/oligopeptide/nickel transport system permease subunit
MMDVSASRPLTDDHPTQPVVAVQSPFARAMGRLMRNPSGRIGFLLVGLFCLVALLAPVVAPYDPVEQFPGAQLRPPSAQFPLGTDDLGRDILSRLLYGSRISLAVGLISVAIGFGVGATSGLLGGYVGGWVDGLMNRLWDCLLAFPAILLGIAIVLVIGPGAVNAAVAVGIFNIPVFARLARACALTEKERDYVLAERALGASNNRIVFQHILPNVLSPLLVQVMVAMAFAILLESTLSFLGLGTQPPDPSWGSMLSTSRQFLRTAWWYGVFPGLALSTLLVGFNFLSEAVRDALDPRQINLGR